MVQSGLLEARAVELLRTAPDRGDAPGRGAESRTMTNPKRHRDPNQLAKSIALRPSRRLVGGRLTLNSLGMIAARFDCVGLL
jgi:hypothetical protein